MGLSYDQLFPSRFIKAGEFAGKPVTLTITGVDLEELEKEDGTAKSSPIVSFNETKRQWVLIKTNAQCLVAMWGSDVDGWIGHKVTLVPERDASGLSDSGFCIRVQGSPELTQTIQASIKLPRRKPIARKLIPTRRGQAAEVDFDESTGEMHESPQDSDSAAATTAPPKPLGKAGWKQLAQDAEGFGYTAKDVLASAAIAGHEGPEAEMPLDLAKRIFRSMRDNPRAAEEAEVTDEEPTGDDAIGLS